MFLIPYNLALYPLNADINLTCIPKLFLFPLAKFRPPLSQVAYC